MREEGGPHWQRGGKREVFSAVGRGTKWEVRLGVEREREREGGTKRQRDRERERVREREGGVRWCVCLFV